MVKNLNKVDVAICLYALDDIERESRQQVVLLRGRVITRGDINTYLKKTKKREENLRATIPRPTLPDADTPELSRPQRAEFRA
jgi:hypothetical protein